MNNNDLFNQICPYCYSKVLIKDSSIVYGKSYGYVYICSNFPKCDSYVGCHPRSKKPLGRLANKELRNLKMEAHKYFDYLWALRKKITNDRWSRSRGYKWLSQQMKKEIKDTHIGMFDIEEVKKVIEICKPYYFRLGGK